MRILVFSERLRLPLDEGFKNTAIHLSHVLRAEHDVLILTTFGQDIADAGVRNVPANKLLLSRALYREIRGFGPHVILYIPTASATPAAMLRTRVLARYAPTAHVAMLALQPRSYDPVTRLAVRWLRPPLIIAQSQAMVKLLGSLGCRVALMRSGVDTDRFVPIGAGERAAVRRRLGLPENRFIVLHVGHMTKSRNVQLLAQIQATGCQAVLVGSTSTEQDEGLAHSLSAAGVTVVRSYVSHIEEYYQAADCYLFPVISDTGAIALPLSVLEAMACNLPIVTTPYGDLATLFQTGDGLFFARSDAELIAGVLAVRQGDGVGDTRSLVLPFTWQAVARQILEIILAPS